MNTKPHHTRVVTELPGELKLEFGGKLRDVHVTWEQYGDPSLPADRTIFIIPSFSNSSHVSSNLDDRSPGWWEGICGPGKPIDTSYFRVICAANLGAPFGTTSPVDINPATNKQYRMDFPQITPADQARVHRMLLDHLGLQAVHAIIGNSMGGMVALQFASLYPQSCARLGIVSCTAKTSPGTVALRHVQREAIISDSLFNDGQYGTKDEEWPTRGMRVARELGMFCYRAREEFDQRFDWNVDKEVHDEVQTKPMIGQPYEVERYLNYMGRKFAKARYDPCCYLLQSRSMDLMDIGHGFGRKGFEDGVNCIDAERVLAIGVKQDLLIPAWELDNFIKALNEGRKQQAAAGNLRLRCARPSIFQSNLGVAQFEELDSLYGHDAFLKEFDFIGPRIKKLIEYGIEDRIHRFQHDTEGAF